MPNHKAVFMTAIRAADEAYGALRKAQKDGVSGGVLADLAYKAADTHREARNAGRDARIGDEEALGWSLAIREFTQVAEEALASELVAIGTPIGWLS